MACEHMRLYLGSSPHAPVVGYKPRTLKQIANAAGLSIAEATALPGFDTYPQPLVLPGDELAWDPKYPAQTLAATKQCLNHLDRSPGGPHVIYVATPPTIGREAPKAMQAWSKLRLPQSQRTNLTQTPSPRSEDVLNYISAFYHGLPVKFLSEDLQFVSWDEKPNANSKKNGKFPIAIGLQTSKEIIQIRCRELTTGPYRAQLNLNDLLDAAIAILPQDAYALLMLIEHDLYEDENDDFCCGRAYGGSRIACVSTARYHPAVDAVQDVDLEHAWPVSHCAEFVKWMLSESDSELEPKPKKLKKSGDEWGPTLHAAQPGPGAMQPALRAYPKNLETMTLEAYAGLWLGRFCRTASHELGHCFGMDHCLYYACAMQGTASVSEDMRQPPYMCPVDLAKLLYTTGATEEQHHQALLRYCEQFSDQRGALFWTPFAAWLRQRIQLSNKMKH